MTIQLKRVLFPRTKHTALSFILLPIILILSSCAASHSGPENDVVSIANERYFAYMNKPTIKIDLYTRSIESSHFSPVSHSKNSKYLRIARSAYLDSNYFRAVSKNIYRSDFTARIDIVSKTTTHYPSTIISTLTAGIIPGKISDNSLTINVSLFDNRGNLLTRMSESATISNWVHLSFILKMPFNHPDIVESKLMKNLHTKMLNKMHLMGFI